MREAISCSGIGEHGVIREEQTTADLLALVCNDFSKINRKKKGSGRKQSNESLWVSKNKRETKTSRQNS